MPPVLDLLADTSASFFVHRSEPPPPLNSSIVPLQVVCAWPVSDQYGPGSRVLYYVLVLACVLARKNEWLRNACLAAALLFPAVAAIHAVAIAALNIPGAVDLDIYGAFQLCSIGILAAPVTARLSTTYFNDPGRNIIFLWTSLMLAGLISLMVEFYRQNETDCLDRDGNPIALDPRHFPLGNQTCGLTCSIDEGPFSPMRGGSANEIYVIPAPTKLTFGTATLIAAGCCIPAILSLVSMWNKILKDNWTQGNPWGRPRYGDSDDEQDEDDPIEGTNGATRKRMEGINSVIRKFLSAIEAPFFIGAVAFILIIGELNFFSPQLLYGIEPVACIGGWGPIVAAGLAALGSLYVLQIPDRPDPDPGPDPYQRGLDGRRRVLRGHDFDDYTLSGGAGSHDGRRVSSKRRSTDDEHVESVDVSKARTSNDGQPSPADVRQHGGPSSTSGSDDQERTHRPSVTGDVGARKRVARFLNNVSDWLVTPAPGRYDVSEFKLGRAGTYPTVPGEERRNRELRTIEQKYRNLKANEAAAAGLTRQNSRVVAFPDGIASRSPSPSPTPTIRSPSPARVRAMSAPTKPQTSSSEPGPGPPKRSDTLQVPGAAYHTPTRSIPAAPSSSIVPSSPTIVVSSPDAAPTPVDGPD